MADDGGHKTFTFKTECPCGAKFYATSRDDTNMFSSYNMTRDMAINRWYEFLELHKGCVVKDDLPEDWKV